jgi:hypothetical protein
MACPTIIVLTATENDFVGACERGEEMEGGIEQEKRGGAEGDGRRERERVYHESQNLETLYERNNRGQQKQFLKLQYRFFCMGTLV